MSICLGSVSCSEEKTGDITLTETSAAAGVQPAAATVNALSSEEDATACCSQGLEFVPADADNYTYPDDFPAVGDQITVTGTFDTYQENGITYCTLRNASLCAD